MYISKSLALFVSLSLLVCKISQAYYIPPSKIFHRKSTLIHATFDVDEESMIQEKSMSDYTIFNATDKLVTSLEKGFSGNKKDLNDLLAPEFNWISPFISSGSDFFPVFNQFSNFFGEPRITAFETNKIGENQVELNCQLSFWYPLPWRPRVIIPIIALITFSNDFNQVQSVKEKWKISLLNIITKQMLPRWWDVFHLFNTPCPEYPPIKTLAKIDKVSVVELPETISYTATWSSGLKYPGPPILVVPGFSLIGNIKKSKTNNYYTVLPAEVQSSKFKLKKTGEERKETKWVFHVPTSLQHLIKDKAQGRVRLQTEVGSLLESGDGLAVEDLDDLRNVDYKVNIENLNVLKSLVGGIRRGVSPIDREKVKEYEEKQKVECFYDFQPRRVVGMVEVNGEVTSDVIQNSLKMLRKTLKDGVIVENKKMKLIDYNMKKNSTEDKEDYIPLFGMQLFNSKVGFNEMAEPAMALYEIQFDNTKTKLFLELEYE